MTNLALARLVFTGRFADLWKPLVSWRKEPTPTEDLQEEARARRDFALEMLNHYPDACQGDLNVEHLAHLYRGRF